MISNKQNIEFIEESAETKNGRKTNIRDIIDGSLLTNEFLVRQFPFILYLVFLALLYIGNRYHAEKIVRETLRTQVEIKELQSESVTIASELMFISRQSAVQRMLNQQGIELKESIAPPKKIKGN